MRSSFALISVAVLVFGCDRSDPSSPTHEHSLADIPAQKTKVVVTGADPTPGQVPTGTDAVDVADPDGPPPVPPADRVLTADLHGDGTPEVFVASGGDVRWGEWPPGASGPVFSGRHAAQGMLQTWLAKDLDGDGKEEVLMAFGMGRGFAGAKGTVVLLRASTGGSIAVPLWTFSGPRTQITALQAWPRSDGTFDVYVAAFKDRFTVRGGVIPRDGGPPRWLDGHELRMGMYRAVGDFDGDGEPETAIGRLYGDEKGTHGDLRVVHHDGTVDRIDTLRGVRAVGAGDLDGDGRVELLFGDGWDKNYGKLARYRPTVARWANGTWTTELVEESADQYAVEQIGVMDGRLVAGGNRFATVYARGDEGWSMVGSRAPTTPSGTWAVASKGTLIVGGKTVRRVDVP
jgi:hypothetical protein